MLSYVLDNNVPHRNVSSSFVYAVHSIVVSQSFLFLEAFNDNKLCRHKTRGLVVTRDTRVSGDT